MAPKKETTITDVLNWFKDQSKLLAFIVPVIGVLFMGLWASKGVPLVKAVAQEVALEITDSIRTETKSIEMKVGSNTEKIKAHGQEMIDAAYERKQILGIVRTMVSPAVIKEVEAEAEFWKLDNYGKK